MVRDVTDRFSAAVAAIDAANTEDPRRVTVRGAARPKDLVQGELATEWVRRLSPSAGELLLLAARAHHLRRWQWPRSTYPMGRAGYLKWRRDLHDRHAGDLAEILGRVGYEESEIERARALVHKRGLGRDPEVQVLEDAVCLVFLETDYAGLAARTEPEKLRDIVEKTLAKMSDEGKRHALSIEGVADELARLGVRA